MIKILLICLLPLTTSCAQAPKKPVTPPVTYGALQSVVLDNSAHDAALAPEEEKKLAVARIDAQIEQVVMRQDWTKFKIGLLTTGTAVISAATGVLLIYISGQCK